MEDNEKSHTTLTHTPKSFRMSTKYWFLTYSQDVWLDKEIAFKWYVDRKKNNPLHRIIIAHEVCPTTKKKHTHVVLEYAKRIDTTSPKHWDITIEDETYHCNMQSLTSYGASKKYLSKEDKQPLVWEAPNAPKINTAIQEIWECETEREAISKVKKLSDVIPTQIVWRMGREEDDVDVDIEEFYPWQEKLLEELERPITKEIGNKITWIVDKKGGSGKTAFCWEMVRRNPKRYAMANETGANRDFATVVQSAMETGWRGGVFFLNFARYKQEKDSMYGPIESLSDRMVTVIKYRSEAKIIPKRVKVVIFANWPPQIDKLSYHRWDIREIIKDEDGVLQCYSRDAAEYMPKKTV